VHCRRLVFAQRADKKKLPQKKKRLEEKSSTKRNYFCNARQISFMWFVDSTDTNQAVIQSFRCGVHLRGLCAAHTLRSPAGLRELEMILDVCRHILANRLHRIGHAKRQSVYGICRVRKRVRFAPVFY
jgi:hypothetical protein